MVHVQYVCDTVCQRHLQERRKGKEIERSLYESMYLSSSLQQDGTVADNFDKGIHYCVA